MGRTVATLESLFYYVIGWWKCCFKMGPIRVRNNESLRSDYFNSKCSETLIPYINLSETTRDGTAVCSAAGYCTTGSVDDVRLDQSN